MKTLKDGWYIAINTNKFIVFEKFFCIIVLYNYCVSALSLYIELTDSMIRSKQHDYYSTTPKK